MELLRSEARGNRALQRTFEKFFANNVGIEGSRLCDEAFTAELQAVYNILCLDLPHPNWTNIRPLSPWFDQRAIRSGLRKHILETRLKVDPSDARGGPGIWIEKRLRQGRRDEGQIRTQYLVEWPWVARPWVASDPPINIKYYPNPDSFDSTPVPRGSYAWENVAFIIETAHRDLIARQAGAQAVRAIGDLA